MITSFLFYIITSFLLKLLIFYNINNINLIYIWNKINFIIKSIFKEDIIILLLFFEDKQYLLLTLVSIINLLKIY